MIKSNNRVSRLKSIKELSHADRCKVHFPEDDSVYAFRYFKFKGEIYDIRWFNRMSEEDQKQTGFTGITGLTGWLNAPYPVLIKFKGDGVVVGSAS